MGILLLAALYKLIPNTRVQYRSAFGGALVAVPLWLLAEWGFRMYVGRVVGRGSFYGALGLLPLFLFWVNLSWLIFLFGAQLAHSAVNLSRIESTGDADELARLYDRYREVGLLQTVHEATLGFNLYLFGPAVKWQVDLGLLVYDRIDDVRYDFQLRTQMQLSF